MSESKKASKETPAETNAPAKQGEPGGEETPEESVGKAKPAKAELPASVTVTSCKSPSCGPILALIVLVCAVVIGLVVKSTDSDPWADMPDGVHTWMDQGAMIPVRHGGLHGVLETKAFVVAAGVKSSTNTIVFVHDVLDSSFAFRKAFDSASALKAVRTVAFDFPGHGLSEANHAIFSEQDQAHWMYSLFHTLELRAATLVCQGSALHVCNLFAKSHPNLVRGVVAFGHSSSAAHFAKAFVLPTLVYEMLPILLPSPPCVDAMSREHHDGLSFLFTHEHKRLDFMLAAALVRSNPTTINDDVVYVRENSATKELSVGKGGESTSMCAHLSDALLTKIKEFTLTLLPAEEEIPEHIRAQLNAAGGGHHHHGHDSHGHHDHGHAGHGHDHPHGHHGHSHGGGGKCPFH